MLDLRTGLIGLGFGVALLATVGCSPPGKSTVHRDLEKKSDCKITNFQLGPGKKTPVGYEYSWSGMADCTKSRSYWRRKFDGPTAVSGRAPYSRSRFLVTWDLRGYSMDAEGEDRDR